MELARDELREMYREMVLIREFENRLEDLYTQDKIPSAIHLCNGQEAIAVGLAHAFDDHDQLLANHRPDGHIIAQDVDLDRMMAEYFGRQAGQCAGKGGSMHFCSVEDGFLGSQGVVGGNLPHAVGLGLAKRNTDTPGAVVCAFGDGASNGGTFGESLNLSATLGVPVLWICENNHWAESTHVSETTAGDIYERATGYDIKTVKADGMDVKTVYQTASEYLDYVRRGHPAFIEFSCYRFKGHSRADQEYGENHYRSEDDVSPWIDRDPIPSLAADLELSDEAIASVYSEVNADLDAAVAYADASDPQTPAGLTIYD